MRLLGSILGISLIALQTSALPEGFELEVLTAQVPSARQMVESDSGTIYVGSLRAGDVYAVTPNVDKTSATVKVIVKDLPMPSGLTMIGDDLVIAALNRILRIKNVDTAIQGEIKLETITDDLPDDTHHGWKYLEVDAEGFLYFNVGAPCNVCLSEDPRFASVLRMNPETGETTNYASGVRNSVGAAWHPTTGLYWFSDNGRDWMGPEVPFEEINVVTTPGEHFGYPFMHAKSIMDPDYGKDKNPEDYSKPVYEIRAHSAVLGITFYTHNHFPPEYKNALFMAEHGSWNHAPGPPRGFRVSVLKDTDDGLKYEAFADQWLVHGKRTGRPNDVLMLRDGSLLISDDFASSIYRVVYNGNRSE